MGNHHSNLILIQCNSCGKIFVPPRYLCAECFINEFRDIALSGEGRILTYTTIRFPPLGFEEQAPYDIAVIQLDKDINITARIAAQEDRKPKIDDRVRFLEKRSGAYFFRLNDY